MKFIFWCMFWTFVLLALVAGLDNLFFQPPMPGWIIAGMCAGSIVYLFYEVRPFRRKR